MKKITVGLVLVLLVSHGHAGLSDIKNLKIVIETLGEDYNESAKFSTVTEQKLNDSIYLALKSKLPLINIDKSSDYTIRLIYKQGLFRKIPQSRAPTHASYYMIVEVLTESYDKIGFHRKIYWQSYLLQPFVEHYYDVNVKVKEQIEGFVELFALDWYKDQDALKKKQ